MINIHAMRNFFNNLFFYLLFLGIGTNVLTSCKEEVESISELSLEQTKIQIKEGETVTVKIIGGSGNYQISLSDEKLAVAQIENNEINIRALLTGCVTLTVTDENGQTALLNIIIISKILDSDKPRFVWTNSIALDEPNGWGLTVFGNKVAVTSCVEQIQYVLEWEGDSTMGKKLNAFLTTLKKGGAPVKIKLTGLEILDIREQCYFITFSVDNKIGELVFIK